MATEDRRVPFQVGSSAVDWFSRNGPALLVTALLVAVWQVYSQFFNTRGDIYFPSPGYTLAQTLEHSDTIVRATQTTVAEIAFGFLLSIVIGVALAVIVSEFFVIRSMSMPLLVFFNAIPHAIVVPLFILWFGTGYLAVGLFVSWMAFFPVFINTITGLTQIKPEFELLGDVTGATEFQMLRHVKIWSALPHVAGGVKVAAQMSIVATIIAEFIATGQGLGYLIISANEKAQGGLMFGVIILIMVFAMVFFNVIDRAIDYLSPV